MLPKPSSGIKNVKKLRVRKFVILVNEEERIWPLFWMVGVRSQQVNFHYFIQLRLSLHFQPFILQLTASFQKARNKFNLLD